MTGEGNSARESAQRDALALLARRPLTEAELRDKLAGKGHSGQPVDAVIERLRAGGYVDDLRLAVHFIASRAARLGHGPRRLVQQLRGRGVDAAQALRAFDLAVEQGEVDPEEMLRAAIRRRLGDSGRIVDRRHHARVYNALLRAGYESERIESQLRALPRDGEVEDEFA